jgi:hypothetical protein
MNWFIMHCIICLQALLKHIDFEVVKCVVIASPGFTKVMTDWKENVCENIFVNVSEGLTQPVMWF